MSRAASVLNDQQRAAVERAVALAEQKTSAQIVVVLATRSGRYDRAEDLFGLGLAVVAVAAAWTAWQGLAPNHADWGVDKIVSLGLPAVLALFIVWAVVGAALATGIPALARPWIGRHQMEAEVRRRGLEAFHTFHVGRTKGRNGAMIYLSLFERIAWVVGDDAVTAALPESTWERACAAITGGFRRGRGDEGLIEAVGMCGAALAEKFPRSPGSPADELPNTVRVMD